MKQYDYDVAIVTAVAIETESVKRCFTDWEKKTFENDDKVQYFVTKFTGASGERRLVTCQQMQMGMTACTLTCQKLIEHFRPRYLIMTGIAAGIGGEEQIYGDVIIPDVIWDYSTGKFVGKDESEIRFGDVGFLPRPSFLRMDEDLVALMKGVSESKEHEFKVHMGMMACGNSVVANKDYVDTRVRALMPETAGLDMESYSVFYTAQNCTKPRPKAIVIKSICDYANTEKSDQYQKFAAYTSSEFAKWLMVNKLSYE